jgi:hypothetical protein
MQDDSAGYSFKDWGISFYDSDILELPPEEGEITIEEFNPNGEDYSKLISIPRQVFVNKYKNRTGLTLTPDKKTALLKALNISGEEYILGKAVDDGGCFFDALAQWLNQTRKTDEYNEKKLRVLCHEFYNSGLRNKETVEDWNKKDNFKTDYNAIQYTSDEIESLKLSSPSKYSLIWGRSYIEGRILCEKLNLKGLYLIELYDDAEPGHFIITAKDGMAPAKEKDTVSYSYEEMPAIMVSQNELHFVPVLRTEEKTPIDTAKENTDSLGPALLLSLQPSAPAENYPIVNPARVPGTFINNLPHAPAQTSDVTSSNNQVLPATSNSPNSTYFR